MPDWYYDQDAFHKTPSIQDGLDYETECAYRKEGARFIMDIGTQMDLGCNTMATGVVFFHRFYMFHSFMAFPRFVTACCCIFLAGKVEETPKKCKDIIKIAQTLLNEEAFTTFGINPKEEVMTLEKILLQTIKFDFKVEHPYCYLIKYAKHLKGDRNRLHKMVQMAWTFINDSLCTTLCLQWEPEIIAIALMYLAGKLSKFKVVSWVSRKSHQTKWWDLFVEQLPMSTLEDICHQVLDLYSTVKDKPQESEHTQSQTVKKDPDIKLENPVILKKSDSQSIQVKADEINLHCNPRIVKEEFHSNRNPIKHELKPIQVSIDSTLAANIKKNPCCNPKIAKETYSDHKPIKHESSIDSTLAVNVKKEPELSQLHDQPKPTIMLHVADWAAVTASAIMSPGTSSVNSPTFLTPNFLVSPVPIGSFNNLFNGSTIHGNVNVNKNLPENCQDSKNVPTALFSSQNSANSDNSTRHIGQSLNTTRHIGQSLNETRHIGQSLNETRYIGQSLNETRHIGQSLNETRHIGQSLNYNTLRDDTPLDNCRNNLAKGRRGFDNFNDTLPKSSRGYDNCNNDNLPKGSRGFGNCDGNLLTNIRAFGNCNNDVPFRSRGFNNINDNLLDNNYNFKIADFSKNYQSCDMLIQDYPDSKDLYNKFKYSAKMRNERDPRTSSRDYPYPKSKSDFCMDSFPDSNDDPYENNEINLERFKSRRAGRRFRHGRRFREPT